VVVDGPVVVSLLLREGALPATAAELLGAGRALADAAGVPLVAVTLGTSAPASDPGAYGADRAVAVVHPRLAGYVQDLALAALTPVVREAAPSVVLLAHDFTGRDLVAPLAWALGASAITDVTAVLADAEAPRFQRPVFGGVARATLAPRTWPVVVTVRPKSQPAAEATARTAPVTTVEPALDAVTPRTQVVETRREQSTKRLEDADVVVAGGRGLGGPESFALLDEAAAALDGVVGASRVAVDSGWVPSSYQVGLTGKIISPKLYVAVGISGAMQHMAGCSTAKTLVAVNRDPEAPILQQAHYAAIGDFKRIIPAFTARARELRGK
jgi:electron transfer flavoprotein alpha subunit